MNTPEQFKGTVELNVESQHAALERQNELIHNAEHAPSSAENQTERVSAARHETEAAFAREASSSEHDQSQPSGFSRAFKRVTQHEKQAAYKQTMTQIRSQMSAPARAFSSFIHNRSVERASGILGNSVARPNSLLSGSTSALILVSAVYVAAKTFGYPLSGFETIGAFIIGWIVGIIYDYARIIFTGRSA